MGAITEKTRELIKEINEIKKDLEDLKKNSELLKESDPSKEEENLGGKYMIVKISFVYKK